MSKIYSFNQLTDSVELLERKPPRFIAGLLGFLFISLLGFIIWAYFGKLDIVSKGTAIIQSKSTISVSRAQVAGTVETIAVKSGDEVKKGDPLVRLKNLELASKEDQLNQIVQYLEKERAMLEQLKKSIQSHKPAFSNEVDTKIKEEFKAYEQSYQTLQNEKENEIESIINSKITDEQDSDLQRLIAEKENIEREIQNIKQKRERENPTDEHHQLSDDKTESLNSQQTNVEKQIQQRKLTLEDDRKKMEITKDRKQKEKQNALNQYRENMVISVNQRIQTLEQDIFMKQQEVTALHNQNQTTTIKAQKDGIVQFSVIIQQGDLVDPGQEMVSIIPKEEEKKVKILLPAEELKDIKKGDKVQYSFKLKNNDKQIGKVTYISLNPIFDRETKTYMYELEATINTKKPNELHIGMVGSSSIIIDEEPIWKLLLRKLDLISD
ncbi:hemolysin D [Bacillus thuringiensis serovar muju]|nr:HlyD family efflux transporter periplasmic adaptor subunit [Bacillus thuringiensis]MBH0346652.1 hemolysin D [Bacillus thuringiensis]OTY09499.1 hemolysin D [Bacillus thuringiensis serovar muju]